MTAPSDIDPRKVDAPTPRKRKRRNRNQPQPHPALEADRAAAIERANSRPPTVAVMLERDGEGWAYTSPHNDRELWELQVADAFGTRSLSVMQTFLRELRDLCRDDFDQDAGAWKPDETELSAALAMVRDIAPQSIREAALAAQMVAVHWLTMRLAKDALNRGGMVMEKQAAVMSRLARTYAEQMNTLRLERGGDAAPVRQEIHVTRESHVHYHDHRGGAENAGQPHGTDGQGLQSARVVSHGPKVPGEVESNGTVLPFARDAEPDGVPVSRRKGRRSQGQG